MFIIVGLGNPTPEYELLCVKDNDFCFGIHKNNPPCFLSFYEAYPENIPVFCVTKAGESCKIGNAV